MEYSVIKPFHSVQQRFRVGDTVTAQTDLAPHSIDSAVAAGLIEEKADEDKGEQEVA